ncbi:hypothetical protein N9F40_01355 [bacterium]|nr:hypothetical protein [bacterium]
MKTRPVDIKPFKELGNPSFAIDTPRDHISLGSLVLCVAKKQSGNTFFLSNLLYQLKQAGCMDRIFCLSDTFDSNKKMLENLDIRPEDILSPNDPDAIDKIVAEIDTERDDLLEYREKVKRWKSFNKKLDINNLEYITADLLEFYDPVTQKIRSGTRVGTSSTSTRWRR